MKWFHRCSFEWLKARQNVLTATDIKSILPLTKTGRARKITDADYLKVWARKHNVLTEDDCISTGVMARGHYMEPYAIEMFNRTHKYPKLYHWDDIVISYGEQYRIGFSPDALSVSPDVFDNDDGVTLDKDICMGEIKSYSPEAHMLCGCSDKMELEERWQIAAAMATMEEITKAYLIFYNPSMPEYQMFVHEYTRQDLFDEINVINAVERDWLNWIDRFTHDKHDNLIAKREEDLSEELIIKEVERKQSLNPKV